MCWFIQNAATTASGCWIYCCPGPHLEPLPIAAAPPSFIQNQSSGKCLRLDHDRWSGCPWTVTNGISSLAECLSVTINVLLLYNDFIMIRKINFNSNRMGDNCRPYSISAQHALHFLGKVDNYSFQMITICDSFNAIGCPLCLPAVSDSFNHISLFHARFGVWIQFESNKHLLFFSI